MKLPEDFIKEISSKLGQLPPLPADEFKKNAQSLMQSMFNKMDLVTREEFEAQQSVLLKTREKLELLEKTVAELEKQSKGSS